jgi:hypothetical protein
VPCGVFSFVNLASAAKLHDPPPTLPHSMSGPQIAILVILSATYGSGRRHVDVTARVKYHVEQERHAFSANPRDLGTDPTPGWNKQLTIIYQLNGKELRKSWGENSRIEPSVFTEE